LRCRHDFRICRASSVASVPGVTPDFDSSPEVLIWMWMLRGPSTREEFEGWEECSSARPLSSCVAFFWLSTEETTKRLGIVEVSGLHLSIACDVSWTCCDSFHGLSGFWGLLSHSSCFKSGRSRAIVRNGSIKISCRTSKSQQGPGHGRRDVWWRGGGLGSDRQQLAPCLHN